jgi:hypothetical protein
VLFQNHFYSHYTINGRRDGLVAMTMDGQVKWKTDQQPPFVRGGMILAEGSTGREMKWRRSAIAGRNTFRSIASAMARWPRSIGWSCRRCHIRIAGVSAEQDRA